MDEQYQTALEGLPVEVRTQIAEAIAGAPAERTDEIVYEILASRLGLVTEGQLLGIDLKGYDQLRTYPTYDGTDWQRMRDRVAFLQTAVRAGIPWPRIVARTLPHFGPILKPPFEPICEPLSPGVYEPPIYDQSRHTPDSWAREADSGWRKHRNEFQKVIQAAFEQLVASGRLRVFDRPRVSRNASRKESIIDEDAARSMAAKTFFLGITWAELADECPPKLGYSGTPVDKARQKKKRANQIRMRVASLLKHIGLPTAQ